MFWRVIKIEQATRKKKKKKKKNDKGQNQMTIIIEST